MEDTNKKNIHAIAQSGEIYTREFFAEAQRKRWAKVSKTDRKKHGAMLAESRKKARRLDEKFSTSELGE
jgi:uncharacterized protein YaiI (UPF0178 family)